MKPELSTDPRRKQRRRFNALMNIVRRVHMYSGMMQAPWLLLYGLSGLLFNHPNCGTPVDSHRISSEVLLEKGIQPVVADSLAQDIVRQINSSVDGEERYRIDETFSSHLHGPVLLKASEKNLQHIVLVDLESLSGVAVIRHVASSKVPPPFSDAPITLPQWRTTEIENTLSDLFTT